MSKLTEKQQAYVDARLAGAKQIDAARAAGYKGHNLSVQASNLAKHPAIKKAIADAKKRERSAGSKRVIDDEAPRLRAKYDTPADLLDHVMNNPRMPDSVRIQTARDLMPYYHAKIAEKGKKESKVDKAKELSGANASRFRTKQPPLRLVK